MAQERPKDTHRGRIVTTSTPDRLSPPWLVPALVVLLAIHASALGTALGTRLHVPRKRAGTYAPLDFVVVLLTFALAGVRDLKALYGDLPSPAATAICAVWDRARLPSRAALSRFLGAVRPDDVAVLGELVLADLLADGLQGAAVGGLLDRDGQRAVLFDDDGTYHGVQQRDLATAPTRPAPVRRSAPLCARGYHGGAKRADVTRTRTALQQAHTQEWLGCWSAPGNGHPFAQLVPACAAVGRYLAARGLAACQGVLRLDGLYGVVRVAALITAAGLGYVMRCKDYRLLRLGVVQAVLATPPHAHYQAPDSPVARAAWQVLGVPWVSSKDPRVRVVTRLLITRRPAYHPGTPRVGKRLGDWVYELFVTDRAASAWSLTDSLSVYFARGGFEGTLAQEDREHDLDRTISWHPAGQDFWTRLGQLAWNVRIRLGARLAPRLVRLTDWAPAAPRGLLPAAPRACLPAPPVASGPPRAPHALPAPRAPRALLPPPRPARALLPAPAAPAPAVARRIASGTRGRGAGRFGGTDFTWTAAGQLRCPAGKLLWRGEQRREPTQVRVLYRARAADCRACALAPRCRGRPHRTDGARSVSVLEPFPPPTPPTPAAPPAPDPTPVPPPPVRESPPRAGGVPPPRPWPIPPLGPHPVVWVDVGAASLRRGLHEALRGQRVEIHAATLRRDPPHVAPETRDQRAHRRQTWAERLAHNAGPARDGPRLCLHGVPMAISDFLGLHRVEERAA
jgi:hypothetical protein